VTITTWGFKCLLLWITNILLYPCILVTTKCHTNECECLFRVFLLLLFLVDIQEATWHLMSATCLSVTREMKEGCNGICTRSDFGHIISGDWKSETEDKADCFDSDYLEILWLAVPGSVRPTAASTR
uniref:Uncharacterized protein n=2 Tax=Triticum urartu TaxID=4572 RepID=A0A8R7QDH2_TRIUA